MNNSFLYFKVGCFLPYSTGNGMIDKIFFFCFSFFITKKMGWNISEFLNSYFFKVIERLSCSLLSGV